MMRGALVLALLAGCGAAGQRRASSEKVGSAEREVQAIAADYVDHYFQMFPEQARSSGLADPRYDASLTDLSPESLRSWHGHEDAWLARIRAIDPRPLEGRPEWATYRIVREQLEVSVAKRVCREELWGVKQMWGWQEGLGLAAAVQPVGTPGARQRLLARWKELPRILSIEVANLREGLRLGYSAPKVNVRLVIEQMDALLKDPKSTYLYEPALRDGDPELKRAVAEILARLIVPAVKRYRDFLAGEYLPRARDAVSIEAQPDGKACYTAYLRDGNGMPLSPEEIHRLGLEQVERLSREVAAIGERAFGTRDAAKVLAKVRTEPRYLFKDAQAMLACYREAVQRARAFLPAAFRRLARAGVVVRQLPPERDSGANTQYQPSEPGRPGTFWVAAANAAHESISSCETTAFHEALPGHHFQMTIALERGREISPVAKHFWSVGFGEGWALYAERLMDELGAFTSDVQRVGHFSDQLLRASRLVVDTGVHALGWSRERGIKYLLAHTNSSASGAASEVDRYLIYPGQATGYVIGMLSILKLREAARARLGRRFDLKEFNDRVLELGNVPLPVLDAHIRRWLDATQSR